MEGHPETQELRDHTALRWDSSPMEGHHETASAILTAAAECHEGAIMGVVTEKRWH